MQRRSIAGKCLNRGAKSTKEQEGSNRLIIKHVGRNRVSHSKAESDIAA